MLYLGIDQHKRKSTFCCIDQNGEFVNRVNLYNDEEEISEYITSLPEKEVSAVLEAGSYWGVMYDILER